MQIDYVSSRLEPSLWLNAGLINQKIVPMSDNKIETVSEIINEAPEYRNPGAGFFIKIS